MDLIDCTRTHASEYFKAEWCNDNKDWKRQHRNRTQTGGLVWHMGTWWCHKQNIWFDTEWMTVLFSSKCSQKLLIMSIHKGDFNIMILWVKKFRADHISYIHSKCIAYAFMLCTKICSVQYHNETNILSRLDKMMCLLSRFLLSGFILSSFP